MMRRHTLNFRYLGIAVAGLLAVGCGAFWMTTRTSDGDAGSESATRGGRNTDDSNGASEPNDPPEPAITFGGRKVEGLDRKQLELEGVTSLTPGDAEQLIRSYNLRLKKLRSLESRVARALVGVEQTSENSPGSRAKRTVSRGRGGGSLPLEIGVRKLDESAAAALGHWDGYVLALSGLDMLVPNVASALGDW